DTVDHVINDLMTNGLRDASGNRVGKTIIFAQNKNHAQFIVDRFNALYPEYKGTFCRRVVCDDEYVQDLILQYKDPEKEPYIAVSVDMLDTGIDVPEIVNLVFFKRVRSKIKFWQMIGRGTRTCQDLFGPGRDKECFYIFDYLGNFEFFRENKHGIEAAPSVSTTTKVFAKQVQLIFHLQDAAFTAEEYQAWRRELVADVTKQIAGLSLERIDVRMKRKYVDKYNREAAFICLSEQDKSELITNLADLVTMVVKDDRALEFDNLMYGLMLAQMEGTGSFKSLKRNVMDRASFLLKKTSIPQVNAKVSLLKAITEDEFWAEPDLLRWEGIRLELRELMKFIEGEPPVLVYTDLQDEEIERTVAKDFRLEYDLQEYKRKVNRFIEENKDNIAIHKLRHNIPLTETDYKMLERIFTGELGTREDYERSFKDTPFGLLVRKIAKLERAAAYEAFSAFINEQNLNADQIAFVDKVIDYVVQNGYMESVAELTKPPFDKPQSFIRLFDHKLQKEFVRIINELKENAVKVIS
ncbi:MAG: DEAD/DEAH box helicase, partial [Firmicutes bacterium]|nr:DEAD/DEAH box helicase [Bacillota bacterium]